MLKSEIIKNHQKHGTDTGSPEVQIALLTSRIQQITTHLKVFKKDFAAKRGLLILNAQRNSFLKYLASNHPTRHKEICDALNLRKKSSK